MEVRVFPIVLAVRCVEANTGLRPVAFRRFDRGVNSLTRRVKDELAISGLFLFHAIVCKERNRDGRMVRTLQHGKDIKLPRPAPSAMPSETNKITPRTTTTLPRSFSHRRRSVEGVSGLQDPRVERKMDFIRVRPRTHQIRRYPARLNPDLCGPGARVCSPAFPFRPWTQSFGHRNPRVR